MADNVTTDELQQALVDLATSMGLSVKEYVEGGFLDLQTYGTDKAAIIARLDAIDKIDAADGVETLAEKIAAFNQVLSNDEGQLQEIVNLITANSASITAESDRAQAAEAQIAGRVDVVEASAASNAQNITNLSNTVAANKTAADDAISGLDTRVTDNENKLDILNGDDTIVGSVANAVKQEADRAKAAEAANRATSDANIATAKQEAIDAAAAYTDTKTAAVQSQVDDLVTAGNDTAAAVTALQGEVDTVESAVGLEADGTFLADDGSDSLYEYVADVAGDANTVRKAIRKVARKAKEADVALGVRIDQEIADRTAAVDALQAQVDDLTGGSGDSLTSLGDRVTVVENDLNDTTDGNGDLVKGVKSRLTDAENALAAEVSRAQAAEAQALADAKAYTDSVTIKAASMDICFVGNAFRGALGLADNDCGAASGGL